VGLIDFFKRRNIVDKWLSSAFVAAFNLFLIFIITAVITIRSKINKVGRALYAIYF
jgi:hypothetical protein